MLLLVRANLQKAGVFSANAQDVYSKLLLQAT